MIKIIAMVAGAGIVELLIAAAARLKTFSVQRSISIQAAPERVYPLIGDLRQFNRWNPYAKNDSNMKTTYHGPEKGPEAGFDFDGNKEVGKGSIRIVAASEPVSVEMKLDMTAPFECHNDIEFSLKPIGGVTEVTWAMQGASPFLFRIVGRFMNMDKMIGRDFEVGLADLKILAERK
jgi:hypothetical protein